MKLWDIVTYQVPKNPIDFGKFSFKVKVTAAEKLWNFREKNGFRMLTQKVIFRFQWNFGILLHTRYQRTLLILGNFRSRSRSQQRKNFEIFIGKNWFPDGNSKSYVPISMKLWDIVTYQVPKNPIDFGKFSFKVKVTAAEKLWNFRGKIGFRMVTQKVMYRFQWNFGILLHTRYQRTLLILGNFCSRSRSQQQKNFKIFCQNIGFQMVTQKVIISI